MSAGLSPHSVEVESCRPDVIKYLAASSVDAQPFGDHGIHGAIAPRPGITRYYTSLKDHAIAVHSAKLTPGGGQGSSPRVEDRREGFAWETEPTDEPHHANDRSPHITRAPPTLEELSSADSKARVWEDGRPKDPTTEPLSPASTKELSVPSSLHTPSRTETNRSSISDVARGMRRHFPDLRMFYAGEKKGNPEIKRSHAPHDSVRTSPKARQSLESTHKWADTPASKLSQPPKATLKDRRQLARKEAMKLTLPLELPTIPPRSRMPVAESYSLIPSRPRSPKTPWTEDRPPEWYHQGPRTAPAPITEVEEQTVSAKSTPDGTLQTPQVEMPTTKAPNGYILGRFRWRTSKKALKPSHEERRNSDDTHTRSPRDVTVPQTERGMRSRSRRFRSSSNDLSTTPQSEHSQSSFTLSRLLKPKRPDKRLLTPPFTRRDKSYGPCKQSMTPTNVEALDKMPIPPSFVPPGLNRVPTPPIFEANGELKGKLADFFFDLQGVHTHRMPASPGGVWDSDALLMSQHTDLEQNGSASEESSQDPISSSRVEAPNHTLFPTKITPTGGTYTPATPPHYLSDVTWSTVDAGTRGAEEIAKLEWVIPEHLPTSPLCPLHAKYRGPSIGLCVFHTKSRSLSEALMQTRSGSKEQRSRSGALSRRQGSALDGSEDADEACGSLAMVVSKRRRAKRRWFSVL